jgi:hypothetical protein
MIVCETAAVKLGAALPLVVRNAYGVPATSVAPLRAADPTVVIQNAKRVSPAA